MARVHTVAEAYAEVFEGEDDLLENMPESTAIRAYIARLLDEDAEAIGRDDAIALAIGSFAAGSIYYADTEEGAHASEQVDPQLEFLPRTEEMPSEDRVTIHLSKQSVTRLIERFLEED